MIRSSDADGAVRAESAEEWAAFIVQWHLVLNATFSSPCVCSSLWFQMQNLLGCTWLIIKKIFFRTFFFSHIVAILTAKPRWRFILLNSINFPLVSWLARKLLSVQLWQVVACLAELALTFYHSDLSRNWHRFTLTNRNAWNKNNPNESRIIHFFVWWNADEWCCPGPTDEAVGLALAVNLQTHVELAGKLIDIYSAFRDSETLQPLKIRVGYGGVSQGWRVSCLSAAHPPINRGPGCIPNKTIFPAWNAS